MKVLWFTHSPMPDLAVALNIEPSPRGGWMPALAEALMAMENTQLAVATALNIPKFRKECLRNIKYYALPLPNGPVAGGRLPTIIDRRLQAGNRRFTTRHYTYSWNRVL